MTRNIKNGIGVNSCYFPGCEGSPEDVVIRLETRQYFVLCKYCGAQGPKARTIEGAKDEWNQLGDDLENDALAYWWEAH